jgi:hypothetical protein
LFCFKGKIQDNNSPLLRLNHLEKSKNWHWCLSERSQSLKNRTNRHRKSLICEMGHELTRRELFLFEDLAFAITDCGRKDILFKVSHFVKEKAKTSAVFSQSKVIVKTIEVTVRLPKVRQFIADELHV